MLETTTPPLYELRRGLSASLAGKRLLYLDILYWNHLCDAALGATDEEEKLGLLRDLRTQVSVGNVICPIEYTTFVELYKQRLPEKRAATAKLIDELSCAVVIIPPEERCFLETLRLLIAINARLTYIAAPKSEVWTRPAFLLGHGELTSNGMPDSDLTRLNSLVRMELWNMRFTELLDLAGSDLELSFSWTESLATQLNASKRLERQKFKTYREVYLAEVRGMLDASASTLGNVIVYLFSRAGGDSRAVTEAQAGESGAGLARMLAAAFETQHLSAQLPSIHVPATLYARIQWEEARRYRPNDFQDFSHAAAGLAYCDAFATERSLASLLKQAKLAEAYRTSVCANISQVRTWLAQDTNALGARGEVRSES